MYNFGIKNKKVQSSTIQCYKQFDAVKDSIKTAIVNTAKNPKEKDAFINDSNDYYLRKNLLKMKTIFGQNNVEKMKDQYPEFYGKKTSGKPDNDFLGKYDNLMANT